jgi:hypothetical protein
MKTLLMIITSLVALSALSCSTLPLINGRPSIKTAPSAVHFSNHTGESFDEAIVVQSVSTQRELSAVEYQYISNRYGQRGVDWFLNSQTIFQANNRIVDVIGITVNKSLEEKVLFFDVTGCFF